MQIWRVKQEVSRVVIGCWWLAQHGRVNWSPCGCGGCNSHVATLASQPFWTFLLITRYMSIVHWTIHCNRSIVHVPVQWRIHCNRSIVHVPVHWRIHCNRSIVHVPVHWRIHGNRSIVHVPVHWRIHCNRSIVHVPVHWRIHGNRSIVHVPVHWRIHCNRSIVHVPVHWRIHCNRSIVHVPVHWRIHCNRSIVHVPVHWTTHCKLTLHVCCTHLELWWCYIHSFTFSKWQKKQLLDFTIAVGFQSNVHKSCEFGKCLYVCVLVHACEC